MGKIDESIQEVRKEHKHDTHTQAAALESLNANISGRIAEVANHAAAALVSRVEPMELEVMKIKSLSDANAVFSEQANWSAAASGTSDAWAAAASRLQRQRGCPQSDSSSVDDDSWKDLPTPAAQPTR